MERDVALPPIRQSTASAQNGADDAGEFLAAKAVYFTERNAHAAFVIAAANRLRYLWQRNLNRGRAARASIIMNQPIAEKSPKCIVSVVIASQRRWRGDGFPHRVRRGKDDCLSRWRNERHGRRGKFESLVIAEALAASRGGAVAQDVSDARRERAESFGAICGGEVTVFSSRSRRPGVAYHRGGGIAQALAKLAADCGWHVSVVDDRENGWRWRWRRIGVASRTPAEYIAAQTWSVSDALVIVSRTI